MEIVRQFVTFLIFLSLFSVLFVFFTPQTASEMSQDLFEDVYEHASAKNQTAVLSLFIQNCNALLDSSDFVSPMDLCDNETLANDFETSCKAYQASRNKGNPSIEELELLCPDLLDKSFYDACEFYRSSESYEEQLRVVCSDYRNNVTTNSTFFASTLITSLPEDFDESFNKTTFFSFFKHWNVILIVLLIPLFFVLYFLERDQHRFFRRIGTLFFTAGLVLLVPFVIIKSILFNFDATDSLLHFLVYGAENSGEFFLPLSLRVAGLFFGDLWSLLFSILFLAIGLTLRKMYPELNDEDRLLYRVSS